MFQINQTPLKVLIYEPYAFNISGNTRYLISIFKSIDRSRIEPILAIPFEEKFIDIIRDLNGRYIEVPTPERLKRYSGSILGENTGRLLTVASIALHTVTLASLIIRERIDVVHCNSIRALMTIGFAAKLTGRPCIWYVKGDLDNPFLDRIGFVLANRVLFLCETNKNRRYPDQVRKYNSKIRILRIGTDLDEMAAAQQSAEQDLNNELIFDKNYINIAFLGQLYPPKGITYLLEAISKVRNEYPNVALYLVGDYGVGKYQNYKSDVDSIIKLMKLDNVFFLGWRYDAAKILSMMDIYALPSLSEGVPRSIVEAMALGKPVVATDVGGVSETVIDGQNGFVVKPKDVNGFAKALLTLAKDKQLRKKMGDNGRKIAFEKYSIRDHIARLENVYLEVTHNSNSG
jgi:glycosyltransferase involved in cell wall biosynthesis